jgi:hypothetical protein
MLRLLVSWLLCLPLAFALALPSAAVTHDLRLGDSCPIPSEPSGERLATLDVDILVDEAQDDFGGTGCVTSCVNLAGCVSPGTGLLPPSSEALQAPAAVWLSTAPERLERPPRV